MFIFMEASQQYLNEKRILFRHNKRSCDNVVLKKQQPLLTNHKLAKYEKHTIANL